MTLSVGRPPRSWERAPVWAGWVRVRVWGACGRPRRCIRRCVCMSVRVCLYRRVILGGVVCRPVGVSVYTAKCCVCERLGECMVPLCVAPGVSACPGCANACESICCVCQGLGHLVSLAPVRCKCVDACVGVCACRPSVCLRLGCCVYVCECVHTGLGSVSRVCLGGSVCAGCCGVGVLCESRCPLVGAWLRRCGRPRVCAPRCQFLCGWV